MAGFSKQDQLLLSAIVRSHRRKFSPARFEGLPKPWANCGQYLAIILRLAVVLRRNRHDDGLPDFEISLLKSTIALRFPSSWLDQAPLTCADLKQEADYLKAAGFSLVFS